MTVNGWIQIGLFALIILALTKPLGSGCPSPSKTRCM